MTVAGPGLSQLAVLVVEPEVVASAEIAHTGGGLQVVVSAGEDEAVPRGRLQVVGAALTLRVVGGVVGGLEDPALPGTEDHGAHRLAGGGAGGRAERLPVEDQPALGGVGGVGGGEVDGCDGGGGGGEEQQDTGSHGVGLWCPPTLPASYNSTATLHQSGIF